MEIIYFDKDVPTVIQELAATLLSYASALALLFLVGAGVYYMAASGDPGKQETAKRAVGYALFGVLVTVLSYALIKVAADIAGN
jgi:succinate dehydrogenase hydrophobic anchor subunit